MNTSNQTEEIPLTYREAMNFLTTHSTNWNNHEHPHLFYPHTQRKSTFLATDGTDNQNTPITNIVQDLGAYFPELARGVRGVEDREVLMTYGSKNDAKGRRFLVGVGSATEIDRGKMELWQWWRQANGAGKIVAVWWVVDLRCFGVAKEGHSVWRCV